MDAQSDTASAASTGGEQMSAVDNKIMADLKTVEEKMDLLESMLNPGADSPAPSVKNHEALLSVIGFLEACAPRMVELVEAAAQGALNGNVLETCLQVNDRLLKQLTEIDTLVLTESAASTTAAAAPPTKEINDLWLSESHDNDNDDDDDDDVFAKKPPAATKSTGEEDDPADIFGSAKPSETTEGVEEKDSFDDFFEERQSNLKSED
jgi:hypothetical protein